MGRSSLLGTDKPAREPARRDTAIMGPGDTSDSGADLMGVADTDESDPNLPVDVAMDDEHAHPQLTPEAAAGAATDGSGTGERRSAIGDAGLREAADISVDQVFTPGAKGRHAIADDEDPDLGFADAAEAGDPLEDEVLDADEGELDDDEAALARLHVSEHQPGHAPPVPGRQPNPEPDPPAQPPDEDGATREQDHKPGRT